jgi:hypothetical protein
MDDTKVVYERMILTSYTIMVEFIAMFDEKTYGINETLMALARSQQKRGPRVNKKHPNARRVNDLWRHNDSLWKVS